MHAIAIHGGAGTLPRAEMKPDQEAAYRAGLATALDAGYAVLEGGGTSLDAVTAAVRILEDDPLFNAGRGAVLTHEGTVELDASIMDGRTLAAGAIAGSLLSYTIPLMIIGAMRPENSARVWAMGIVFGIGWSPCIGPTLAAVQSLAFTEASALRGAILSFVYCLGLGLPFVLLALAFSRMAGAIGWVRRHYVWVMRIGGGMLILVGLLLVTGLWTDFTVWLRVQIPGFETPL